MNPQPVSLAGLVEWLRDESEELMKSCMAREGMARTMRDASAADLRAGKLLAEKMTGRRLPASDPKAIKLDIEINSKIAEKLEAESKQLTKWADELSAFLPQHAVTEPEQKPWLYAIQETNAAGVTSWHDGEQCVFGDRDSAQDEVDCLNDPFPDGENPFQIVPLYRIPAHAAEQPKLTKEQVRDAHVATLSESLDFQDSYFYRKLTERLNNLLTSPVAPPPQLEIHEFTPYPDCYVCGKSFEEHHPPPVAPGEQPPRSEYEQCHSDDKFCEKCGIVHTDKFPCHAPATKLVDAWWDGAVLDESNYHELVQRINIALATAANKARLGEAEWWAARLRTAQNYNLCDVEIQRLAALAAQPEQQTKETK